MWIGDRNWGGRLACSQRGRLFNFTQIRRGVRANILTMESPDAAARHQKEKSKNATEGQGEPVSNIEQTHSGRRGSVFAIVAGSGLPEWYGGPVRSPRTGAATVLPERTCRAIVIRICLGSWPLNALR
jgi:hypothetical protein